MPPSQACHLQIYGSHFSIAPLQPNNQIRADRHMTVRLITTATDLEPLQAVWNRLADGNPFRSFDWLTSWWKHYGSMMGRELFVLEVTGADGQTIGIAPWYIEHSTTQGNVVRFLADGEV